MKNRKFFASVFTLIFIFSATVFLYSQPPENEPKKKPDERVRLVTIPISIYTKKELKQDQAEEFLQTDRLTVEENNAEKQIVSIRSVSDTPLALAVVIQDDLGTNVNLELENLKKFIKRLPAGSRVMVAYLRSGTVQIRQKFTNDLDKAASSLRILSGNSAAAPRNPYDGIVDVLNRFDALPNGRRAILMVSDGLDASNGLDDSAPTRSIDLERAITRAQRKSVAIYSFYSAGSLTGNSGGIVVSNAQGSLEKLSDETGGRAFFSGISSPVSFDPFFKDLVILLNRQFAITYLSNSFKKGYYKVKVTSTNPEIKIEHPKGYYFR